MHQSAEAFMESLPETPKVKAHVIAKIYGMGLSSVYRLAAQSTIPSYKTGPGLSGVRFDLGEVREALRRTTHGKSNEAEVT